MVEMDLSPKIPSEVLGSESDEEVVFREPKTNRYVEMIREN
jgi:hypothetical protein